MKVLLLPFYIYEPQDNYLIKDTSGYSLLLHEIAEYLGRETELYVLCKALLPAKTVGNIHYISHTKRDIFASITLSGVMRALKTFFFCSKLPLRKRFIYACHMLDVDYTSTIIKKYKPDIVHIHAITISILEEIKICHTLNIPVIVTLHGLIGIDDSVEADLYISNLEGKTFKKAQEDSIPISLISSGVKKRAIAYYNLSGHNLTVVLNGTNTTLQKYRSMNVRSLYNILPNQKIIVCIGSVCTRKNQIELLEAYCILKQQGIVDVTVLILGEIRDDGVLSRAIDRKGISDHFKLCGFVDKDRVNDYLAIATLNVLPSKDEGFGLSLIEAMVCGVPSVTYADLDAIPDIYDPCAMLLLPHRGAEALARGIIHALNIDWDADAIRQCGQRFSYERMRDAYISLYKQTIGLSR